MELIMTSREKKEIDNMRVLLKMMSEKDQQFVDGFFKGVEMVMPHIHEKNQKANE